MTPPTAPRALPRLLDQRLDQGLQLVRDRLTRSGEVDGEKR